MINKLIALSLLAAFALALTGCAPGQGPGTPVGNSAAIGGLSGAGIGALVDKKNPLAGAAIGAGIGTVGGAMYGQAAQNNQMNSYPPPPPARSY